MFVSISFIVLMMISLAWLVFYYIQRFRYLHAKDRLSVGLANLLLSIAFFNGKISFFFVIRIFCLVQRELTSAAQKALSKIPTRTIKNSDKVLTLCLLFVDRSLNARHSADRPDINRLVNVFRRSYSRDVNLYKGVFKRGKTL